MKQHTVFHVKFKHNGTDFYFGSIAAIFELFNTSDIGIKPESLYDFNVEQDNPYENKKVVIRKGVIRRKKGNRRRPIVYSFNIL